MNGPAKLQAREHSSTSYALGKGETSAGGGTSVRRRSVTQVHLEDISGTDTAVETWMRGKSFSIGGWQPSIYLPNPSVPEAVDRGRTTAPRTGA